jgi:hypothetical protein
MTNQFLVNLVDSTLKQQGKSTSNGNYSYFCPFCKHHKRKLEINFTENNKKENPWHCWVCNVKSKSLITLFKKLDVTPEKIGELKSFLNLNNNITNSEIKQNIIQLPKEFKCLSNINEQDIVAKHALKYLKQRGLTKEDILRYNIGYCEEGKYANMIIIPSYDCNGDLNYFIARSFISSYRLNPPVSNDIIGFEFFINWKSPIILCEAAFDAISIKRNAIPLFGKIISSKLMTKIVSSEVNKVYIALDKDAIKDALNHCKTLLDYGKKVYLVEITDKDPNELGFENFTKIIQQTKPLTYDLLMKKRILL